MGSCFTSLPGLWNKKQTMPRESHQRGQSHGGPMVSQNRGPSTSWNSSAKPRRNTKEWGGRSKHNMLLRFLNKQICFTCYVFVILDLGTSYLNKTINFHCKLYVQKHDLRSQTVHGLSKNIAFVPPANSNTIWEIYCGFCSIIPQKHRLKHSHRSDSAGRESHTCMSEITVVLNPGLFQVWGRLFKHLEMKSEFMLIPIL